MEMNAKQSQPKKQRAFFKAFAVLIFYPSVLTWYLSKMHQFLDISITILGDGSFSSPSSLVSSSSTGTQQKGKNAMERQERRQRDGQKEDRSASDDKAKTLPCADIPLFQVFVAVKTSFSREVYKERLPQIQRTWLKDAVRNDAIDIKFFVGRHTLAPFDRQLVHQLPRNNSSSTTNSSSIAASTKKNGTYVDIQPHLVTIESCSDKNLECKTAGLFRYFLDNYVNNSDLDRNENSRNGVGEHKKAPNIGHGHSDRDATINCMADPRPTFFCSFDDDQYVIIPNLLRVLSSYFPSSNQNKKEGSNGLLPYRVNQTTNQRQWHGIPTNLYIGRRYMKDGYAPRPPHNNMTIHFLAGGAGYCLSPEVILRASEDFVNLHKLKVPDDIGVGYVVQEKSHVELREDYHFHSHHERPQIEPREDIPYQVSFGYNNKQGISVPPKHFVDVEELFPREDDPMLFRSLRCFLLQWELNNTLSGRAGHAVDEGMMQQLRLTKTSDELSNVELEYETECIQ